MAGSEVTGGGAVHGNPSAVEIPVPQEDHQGRQQLWSGAGLDLRGEQWSVQALWPRSLVQIYVARL